MRRRAACGSDGRRRALCLLRRREKEGQGMRSARWLADVATDVRFACRQMRAAPGFTAVATLTLALGIGANSAIFALADATLLRPLQFAESDRIVAIQERSVAAPQLPVSIPTLRDL